LSCTMKFYELAQSLWGTDAAAQRANPLIRVQPFHLPKLYCKTCASTTLRFEQHYCRLSKSTPEELSVSQTLEIPEWNAVIDRVRRANNISSEYALYPGATKGGSGIRADCGHRARYDLALRMWLQYKSMNPDATRADILGYAIHIVEQFGLEGLEIVKYK